MMFEALGVVEPGCRLDNDVLFQSSLRNDMLFTMSLSASAV